jgi:methyl-accepting chemotaxis protein
MTIKLKFSLLFVMVVGVCIGGGVFCSLKIINLFDVFASLESGAITTEIEIAKAGREINYVSRLTRNIMLGSDYEKDMQKLDETVRKIENSFTAMEKAAYGDKEKAMIKQAKEDALAFVADARSRMIKLKDVPAGERHLTFSEYEHSATPLAMKSRTSFDAVTKSSAKQFEESVKEYKGLTRSHAILIGTVAMLVALAAAAVILALARSVLKPIKMMDEMVGDIVSGEGDLTKRIDVCGNDEIGQISGKINLFIEKLHSIISKIAGTSTEVASSASMLNTNSEQIATAAEQVVSQAGTVATAGEEMAATSGDIAQTCQHAVEAANRATETARNGFEVVQRTVSGIKYRGTKTKENAAIVASLGE